MTRFFFELMALIVSVMVIELMLLHLIEEHVVPAIMRRFHVWRGRRAARRELAAVQRVGAR